MSTFQLLALDFFIPAWEEEGKPPPPLPIYYSALNEAILEQSYTQK